MKSQSAIAIVSTVLCAFVAALASCAAQSATQTSAPAATSGAITQPLPALHLDPFYAKQVNACGIPIVSSARVPDEALLAAADQVNHMLANRTDLCKALAEEHVRVAVMAQSEVTTDIPEHCALTPKEYWDKRARGLGGTPHIPTTSCAEENLCGYPDDRYCGECILIHEFAHSVHEVGMRKLDPAFDGRLQACFEAAISKGLWKETYAATNRQEYWAEGVQAYFDCNARADPPNGVHNHVRTRDELSSYDPQLAALVDEVFASNPWRWKPNGAHARAW